MIALIEHQSFWLVLVGLGSFLLNSLAFVLLTFHQKKKADLLLKESQTALRSRIRLLEEEQESARQEQRDRWSEIRKTIARLEFRGGGPSEQFQRSSTVGLDKKHQVCSLARQGLATEEISKKLNLYRGETELVLGLRNYGTRTEMKDARTSLL
jgi:hypothetical protein